MARPPSSAWAWEVENVLPGETSLTSTLVVESLLVKNVCVCVVGDISSKVDDGNMAFCLFVFKFSFKRTTAYGWEGRGGDEMR